MVVPYCCPISILANPDRALRLNCISF